MRQRNPWELDALGTMVRAPTLVLALMLSLALAPSGCPRQVPAAPDPLAATRPPPPTRWRSVSAGIDHTCAIAQDRSVWCWGANRRGQVGDGTLTDRDRPTRVRGVTDAALVAAGYRRTFALTTKGDLWGWGTVKTGEVTRAEVLPYARPRRVDIGEPVLDYRIGSASCARTRPGNLWCWQGQWGSRRRASLAVPRRLAGLPKIVDFDSGVNHFCAVDSGGLVWCWGANGQGQLGNGSRQRTARPVRVPGLPLAAGVVCGSKTTCALTRRGAVWCWGLMGRPKPGPPAAGGRPGADLGDPGARAGPTPSPILRPRPLAGVKDVISLVLGTPTTWARTRDGRVVQWKTAGAHTAPRRQVKGTGHAAGLRFGSEHRCVLDTGGRVRCWGDNAKGQLGDSTLRRRTTPALVPGIPKVTQLSVGSYHACGLTRRGRIWCWGDDTAGQLGQGAPTRWRTPSGAVPTLEDARHGAAGQWHACAIRRNGDVWCWGRHFLVSPDGSARRDRLTPRRVSGVRGAVALASFGSATCALKRDRTVWCWGDSTNHILGRPRGQHQGPEPRPVHGLQGATRVSVGYDHACALERDRTVRCWGGRFHQPPVGGIPVGGPSDDHRKRADPPITREVFREAITMDTGWNHTCAIRRDGTVWCWGHNRWGNLGDGSRKAHGRPVRVKGLGAARSVAAGFGHSCAVTTDGVAHCWGDNRRGQLGTTTPRLSATPRSVPGLPRATAIYAGTHHTCARTARGALWCWGRWVSAHRQGQGPSKPTLVPGLRNVTHAWLGSRFTCALDARGAVRCWGDNPHGQLGRPPLPLRACPVVVGAR